jgi:ADP-heptose:LPS heptosyltransferase
VYDKRGFTGPNIPPPELFGEKITQLMLGAGSAKGILRYLPALHIPEKYKEFAEGFFSSNHLAGSTMVFMNPYRTSHQSAWGGVEASHTLPRYFSVAKTLSDCGVKVLMHERGGPDETFDKNNLRYYQEEYESRRREVEKAGIILTGKISVGQLVAMISKCDMLLGEPSGPSWVAAALGKPTVTIAPSVACSLASWLPVIKETADVRNAKHTVIVHGEGKPVTVDAVARILLERLQARPGRYTYTGDTSDLELSKQTTVVLDGVEVAETERAA